MNKKACKKVAIPENHVCWELDYPIGTDPVREVTVIVVTPVTLLQSEFDSIIDQMQNELMETVGEYVVDDDYYDAAVGG